MNAVAAPVPDVVERGVVTAVQQHAAEAGARILRQGGNAADAAVAVVLAQGVVDPMRCGIGGGGMALVHDGKTGETTVLNFYGQAPAAARSDMFEHTGHVGTLFKVKGMENQFGYRASIIPGLVRGLDELHRRHGSGTVPWADLLQPAIEYAEDGFLAYPFWVRDFVPEPPSDNPFAGLSTRTLLHSEGSRAIFAPDGRLPKLGDRVIQREYGATLRRIAQQGAEEFYVGETAERIIADYQAHGGLLTADDLRDYPIRESRPAEGTYQGLTIRTEGAPSVGPTFLQYLNILEGWDLPSFDLNSPEYVDRLTRALNVVFQDRFDYMGDPAVVDVPLDRLLDKGYATQCRDEVEAAMAAGRPQERPGQEPRVGHGSRETTHTTVVDVEGNAVQVTHSLGSSNGMVTPGLGFLHNNHMIQYDPRPGQPNSIVAGGQPNIGGGPAVVLQDGVFRLGFGSPGGGRKVSGMSQMLAAMTNFGLDAQSACNLDRFHAEDVPMEVECDLYFDPRCAVALTQMGYDVDLTTSSARIPAVERTPEGQLRGVTDYRGDRGVAYA